MIATKRLVQSPNGAREQPGIEVKPTVYLTLSICARTLFFLVRLYRYSIIVTPLYNVSTINIGYTRVLLESGTEISRRVSGEMWPTSQGRTIYVLKRVRLKAEYLVIASCRTRNPHGANHSGTCNSRHNPYQILSYLRLLRRKIPRRAPGKDLKR